MGKLETALKIQKFLKTGYVPSRTTAQYSDQTKNVANCFEHACFNFPDEFLANFDTSDKNALNNFLYPEVKASISVMKDFLKQTGLEVQSNNSSELRHNQWKVAIYFSTIYDKEPWEWETWGDFHLMLQEKDGTWSNKFGNQKDVIVYNNLPETFKHAGQTYRLHEIIVLTNPYAKEKSD